MPRLISKLQYKNYETGEFVDEQPRDLEQTLDLIKNFPWDSERYLTDVQLTGPSVTIQSQAGEYLKVGVYFNKKFALYYFDKKRRFYEHHVSLLNDVYFTVTDFFGGKVNTSVFEKHFFNLEREQHCITRSFKYTFNKWAWAFSMTMITLFTLLSSMLFFTALHNLTSGYFIALAILLFGIICISMLINQYRHSKNVSIQISKGQQSFTITNHGKPATYNKADVTSIILPRRNNNRRQGASFSQLVFNNGTSIKISTLIIAEYTLAQKLPDVEIKYGGWFSSFKYL